MMRLVIMGVAAFLVSLGGTTGALVMKARKAPPAAADSAAHHDSTGAHADSAAGHVAAEPHDTTGAAPVADPAQTAIHHDSAAHRDTPAPGDTASSSGANQSVLASKPPAPAGGGSAEAARLEAASYKQLARIFANMKTTDAAKVLAFMSDDEVEGVLRQLGVRPAAGLLAALPKERAAALSRRLLDNNGKGSK